MNSSTFRGMSDVLANKFFEDLEVESEDFIWIEHFPELTGQVGKKERFSKVEYEDFGKKLGRVGACRVYLEQIEHLAGEELRSVKVLDLKKKNEINLGGFE